MLMEQSQNESRNLGFKKVNCNIILLTLTSDISPNLNYYLKVMG